MDEFRFSTELKVRFSETDAQGVAHHAAYLDWLEVARVEYLAQIEGGYQGLRDKGIEATTLEAHVRYRAPARFDDELVIRTRCGDVRGARFRFDYLIERDGRADRRRLDDARVRRRADATTDTHAGAAQG